MRLVSLILLLAVPATVRSCEGDCIVGITNAWLSNYTEPVNSVMDSMASQISDLISSRPPVETSRKYLEPIMAAYRKQAYKGMETAIFPSYFHGKCLDETGVTPSGCPNPDCPIVCGTPGSLVHFFPKLRYIVFNQTYHHLQKLSTPGSETYQQVEDMVLQAASQSDGSPAQRRRSNSRIYARGLLSGLNTRAPDVKAGLHAIMHQMRSLLQERCGGNGEEETNGLPQCSWEDAMKEYILTFP
ncbi:hypothetical protein C8Q76DRAFT_617211 [Earliella scabrosa]|nr:hypothetical protein C8Q76DRAFT_617211 [Earliella scabrosa]